MLASYSEEVASYLLPSNDGIYAQKKIRVCFPISKFQSQLN